MAVNRAEVNRSNATDSTGSVPRKVSVGRCLMPYVTASAAKTVVLPTDDLAAYQRSCANSTPN